MDPRQAAPVTAAPAKRVVTLNVPSWELARMKAEQEEYKDKKMEPTSLVGAVRALNVRNTDARNSRSNQGAQQRLRQRSQVRQEVTRDRSSSGSSVRYLGERRKSPERERERGTTFARTSSPKFAAASSARFDSGDKSSNNKEKDAIRMQQCKVDLEIAKLDRMKSWYAKKRSQRK